jgi:hypothetical protein
MRIEATAAKGDSMADIDAWRVFDAAVRSRLHVVIGVLVLWAVAGAVAGLILSGLLSRILSRRGALRLAWKHGIWLKICAIVWIVGACCVLGCLTGLFEGALRTVTTVAREGLFRTEVIEPLGGQCAAGMAIIDRWLYEAEKKENVNEPLTVTEEQGAFLNRFKEGKEELDVQAFLERLENVESTVVETFVRDAAKELRERYEIEEGSLSEAILKRLVSSVVRGRLRKMAKNELDKVGLAEAVTEFFEKLPEAAATSGNPATITFDELATHSVEHFVVPTIVGPVRKFVRAQHVAILLLSAAAVLLPVLLLWLGRRIELRIQGSHPASRAGGESDSTFQ